MAELWATLEGQCPPAPKPSAPSRRRDQILRLVGFDTDELVHPVLIRLCSAFLDQGVAYWPMPGREDGLLSAFRRLFGLPDRPLDPAWRGLAEVLRRQASEGWSAVDTVLWALEALEVPQSAWPVVIQANLLSLRGWAGMVRQFELRPDRVPVRPAPARLADFLAVQLVLKVFATRYALARYVGPDVSPADLGPVGHPAPAAGPAPDPPGHRGLLGSTELAAGPRDGADTGCGPAPVDMALVYEAFVLAQLMDMDLGPLLDPGAARAWLDAVAEFDERWRRWLLHLAYERRYRTSVLDALYAHDRRTPAPEGSEVPAESGHPAPASPGFPLHAVFCMDEREESLRRHLEECRPDVRTYGAAGFFGVTMAYQGLDDIRPRALCPVTQTPAHLVVERAVSGAGHDAYRRAMRRYGWIGHTLSTARGTLGRGAVLTMIVGLVSVVPLVCRCLFPRTAERWARQLHHRVAPRPQTRLVVERPPAIAGPGVPPATAAPEHGSGSTPPPATLVPGVGTAALRAGFTVPEMADIVETTLVNIGLTTGIGPTDWPGSPGGPTAPADASPAADPAPVATPGPRPAGPLVLVVGHGSSSLNNPHEAAHDCGATGGGQGGPNARAFAVMANHPRVREELAQRGLRLHPDAWFVGAYHNTCDESVEFYDTDLVPGPSRPALRQARKALGEACRLDAHERCRRFESAPDDIDADEALAHVQEHARDIGQPRPEYGHATNAVCVIGRRSRTRGLYLDRRAFLVSYDPTADPDGEVLTRLLLSAGPVGAGINLEYYFSFVDPVGYGCGTKLPHNITGLIGVMDGSASDLRTGLPWQMVEIHEPMRLLVIAEAEPESLLRILRDSPDLDRLVSGGWIQLVAWNPYRPESHLYLDGSFRPHHPENPWLPVVSRSADVYAGHHGHLGCAEVLGGAPPRAAG